MGQSERGANLKGKGGKWQGGRGGGREEGREGLVCLCVGLAVALSNDRLLATSPR